MNITKKYVTKNIILLIFKNQKSITSTFLRFQEHYESPKFKNKIFSLNEYKKWYIKQKGKFSYYTDWNGFNIPSHVLKPFKQGLFNPLTKKEKKLLMLLQNEDENTYIIGVHQESNTTKQTLKHEIAHGFFHTNKKYRNKVLKILKEFNTKKLKDELRTMSGYHEDVLNDEVHAYTIASSKSIHNKLPIAMAMKLKDLFEKEVKEKKINFTHLLSKL